MDEVTEIGQLRARDEEQRDGAMSFKKEILTFGSESKPEIGERKNWKTCLLWDQKKGVDDRCEMQ
jgi:hypothetical protein